VRWVALAGLSSPEIAREVLGTADIDYKSLVDTVSIIEAKERAARACVGKARVSALSAYKKEKKTVMVNCGDLEGDTEVRPESSGQGGRVPTVHGMLPCTTTRRLPSSDRPTGTPAPGTAAEERRHLRLTTRSPNCDLRLWRVRDARGTEEQLRVEATRTGQRRQPCVRHALWLAVAEFQTTPYGNPVSRARQ
jgi:hypothetical protein